MLGRDWQPTEPVTLLRPKFQPAEMNLRRALFEVLYAIDKKDRTQFVILAEDKLAITSSTEAELLWQNSVETVRSFSHVWHFVMPRW